VQDETPREDSSTAQSTPQRKNMLILLLISCLLAELAAQSVLTAGNKNISSNWPLAPRFSPINELQPGAFDETLGNYTVIIPADAELISVRYCPPLNRTVTVLSPGWSCSTAPSASGNSYSQCTAQADFAQSFIIQTIFAVASGNSSSAGNSSDSHSLAASAQLYNFMIQRGGPAQPQLISLEISEIFPNNGSNSGTLIASPLFFVAAPHSFLYNAPLSLGNYSGGNLRISLAVEPSSVSLEDSFGVIQPYLEGFSRSHAATAGNDSVIHYELSSEALLALRGNNWTINSTIIAKFVLISPANPALFQEYCLVFSFPINSAQQAIISAPIAPNPFKLEGPISLLSISANFTASAVLLANSSDNSTILSSSSAELLYGVKNNSAYSYNYDISSRLVLSSLAAPLQLSINLTFALSTPIWVYSQYYYSSSGTSHSNTNATAWQSYGSQIMPANGSLAAFNNNSASSYYIINAVTQTLPYTLILTNFSARTSNLYTLAFVLSNNSHQITYTVAVNLNLIVATGNSSSSTDSRVILAPSSNNSSSNSSSNLSGAGTSLIRVPVSTASAAIAVITVLSLITLIACALHIYRRYYAVGAEKIVLNESGFGDNEAGWQEEGNEEKQRQEQVESEALVELSQTFSEI
jgi:hypothetical protein